ncbi:glutathione peroxidase [Helicovermis profundi]|uniref:Glutathione peroxidase n=1 Tax=Helicovermis profundi TaxID=3065157 RepID=A0AAU9EGJ7_9FIRM|nr:glutathione peroxidase [Clostridia bacterium S502]
MSIYNYSFINTDDEKESLLDYKGKVLLVVNTASKCGFTPQYESLQKLYQKHNTKGFEIIGFPCNQFLDQEPGAKEDIVSFCKINYGVTFPLSQKIEVNGENADPLFKYLVKSKPFEGFIEGSKLKEFLSSNAPTYLDSEIKWNFTKFLVDTNGKVIKRYESEILPESIEADILEYLK